MSNPLTLTVVFGLAGIAATVIGIIITWLITRHYAAKQQCRHVEEQLHIETRTQ